MVYIIETDTNNVICSSFQVWGRKGQQSFLDFVLHASVCPMGSTMNFLLGFQN